MAKLKAGKPLLYQADFSKAKDINQFMINLVSREFHILQSWHFNRMLLIFIRLSFWFIEHY